MRTKTPDFVRAFYSQKKRNNNPILYVLSSILLAVFCITSLTSPLMVKADSTSPPYIIGGLCSAPYSLGMYTPAYKDHLLDLSTYKKKNSPDAFFGTNLAVIAYMGEYTDPGGDGAITTYEDGSPRVPWGGKNDFRVHPMGESSRWCLAPFQTATEGFINFFVSLNGIAWSFGNWIFETASNSKFIDTFSAGIEKTISGKNGLKENIFFQYVVISIILTGVYLIWNTFRNRVAKGMEGAIYATFVVILGTVMLSSPLLFTKTMDSFTTTLQSTILSSAGSASVEDPICDSSTFKFGEEESLYNAVSCSTWRALLYEPTTILQWGKASSELGTLKGKTAPKISFGGKNISNWAMYQFYSEMIPNADSDKAYTEAKQRYSRVIDAVAAPGGDIEKFPKWSLYSAGSAKYIIIALIFSAVSIYTFFKIGSVGIYMFIYALMGVSLLFILPIALVFGTHPSGKRILRYWFASFIGCFVHRIGLTMYLAILLIGIMFAISSIGDGTTSVFSGILYIVLVVMGMDMVKRKIEYAIDSNLGAGSSSAEPVMSKIGKVAAIGGGVLAATGLAAAHGLSRESRGAPPGRLGAGMEQFKESRAEGKTFKQSLSEAKTTFKDDAQKYNPYRQEAYNKGRSQAASGHRDVWEGKDQETLENTNYGLTRRKNETEKAFSERVANEREMYKTSKQFGNKTVAELEQDMYGVNPDHYDDKNSFLSAVSSKRSQYKRLEEHVAQKRLSDNLKDVTKENTISRGKALATSVTSTGLAMLTARTHASGVRGVAIAAGRGVRESRRSVSAARTRQAQKGKTLSNIRNKYIQNNNRLYNDAEIKTLRENAWEESAKRRNLI